MFRGRNRAGTRESGKTMSKQEQNCTRKVCVMLDYVEIWVKDYEMLLDVRFKNKIKWRSVDLLQGWGSTVGCGQTNIIEFLSVLL